MRMQTMFQKRAQAMAAINQATKPHVTIPDQFQEGQMVWLEGTNLKLPYQSIKLAPKRQGPFKIIKAISPVAFQLKLPPSWTIHDVFHASVTAGSSEPIWLIVGTVTTPRGCVGIRSREASWIDRLNDIGEEPEDEGSEDR